MSKKSAPLLMNSEARASVATIKPSGMLLSVQELRELTGKTRCDAQARVLDAMGITHRRRPDGTLAVLRVQVEAMLGAGSTIQAYEPEVQP